MYSETYIIYGVPLTHALCEKFGDEYLEECGFTTLYHGNAEHPPGYCGVVLSEFDECNGYTPLNRLSISPSPGECEQAHEVINNLPVEVKDFMTLNTGIYLIHYSS